MRIFLSYASQDRATAEDVCVALTASGHDVFFDKQSLRPAGNYRRKLRKAVDQSELFVFLVSPESVAPECFARAELSVARKKWQNPENRVLPVMLRPTALDRVPAYLKSVTILEPEGDVAAGIATWVEGWSPLEELDSAAEAARLVSPLPEDLRQLPALLYRYLLFQGEVAAQAGSTTTYRRTIPCSVDRTGNLFEDPATFLASGGRDFVDVHGRTCCEVRSSMSYHGEMFPHWETITFVLDRGRWTRLPPAG